MGSDRTPMVTQRVPAAHVLLPIPNNDHNCACASSTASTSESQTYSNSMSLPRADYDPRRVCLNPFPEFTLGKHKRTIGIYISGALVRLKTCYLYSTGKLCSDSLTSLHSLHGHSWTPLSSASMLKLPLAMNIPQFLYMSLSSTGSPASAPLLVSSSSTSSTRTV